MAGERHTGVPDIMLERFRLGELPAEAMRRVQAAVAADVELSARVSTLETADATARHAYDPHELAHDVRRRLSGVASPTPTRGRLAWLVPVAAVAVIAAFAVRTVVWSPAGPDGSIDVHEDDRIKGDEAALFIYRHTESGSQPLADGDVTRPGDVVRVAYRVTTPAYGAIVSVDGRGLVSQHLPSEGGQAVPLVTGDAVLLNEAFELDDAPDVERFYLICAREPFAIGPIADAVRGAAGAAGTSGRVTLPGNLTTTTFSLRKDVRP